MTAMNSHKSSPKGPLTIGINRAKLRLPLASASAPPVFLLNLWNINAFSICDAALITIATLIKRGNFSGLFSKAS